MDISNEYLIADTHFEACGAYILAFDIAYSKIHIEAIHILFLLQSGYNLNRN